MIAETDHVFMKPLPNLVRVRVRVRVRVSVRVRVRVRVMKPLPNLARPKHSPTLTLTPTRTPTRALTRTLTRTLTRALTRTLSLTLIKASPTEAAAHSFGYMHASPRHNGVVKLCWPEGDYSALQPVGPSPVIIYLPSLKKVVVVHA